MKKKYRNFAFAVMSENDLIIYIFLSAEIELSCRARARHKLFALWNIIPLNEVVHCRVCMRYPKQYAPRRVRASYMHTFLMAMVAHYRMNRVLIQLLIGNVIWFCVAIYVYFGGGFRCCTAFFISLVLLLFVHSVYFFSCHFLPSVCI